MGRTGIRSFKEAIKEIVSDKGPEILTDVHRCISLIKDIAPGYTKETNLIEYALKDGIGVVLLRATKEDVNSQKQCTKRCIRQLVNDLSITEEAAYFIVDTLASALNIPVDPLKGETVSEKKNVSMSKRTKTSETIRENRELENHVSEVQERSEIPEKSENIQKKKTKKKRGTLLLIVLLILLVLFIVPKILPPFPIPIPIPAPVSSEDEEKEENQPAVPILESESEPESIPAIVPAPVPESSSEESTPEPENALPYQIDTVAIGIYDLRSMVMDNNNNFYYIDGSTLHCSSSNEVIELNPEGKTSLSSCHLAYDSNKNIVYLLKNEEEGLVIYDIGSEFPSQKVLLNSENCPDLSETGFSRVAWYNSNNYHPTSPQIAILNDGTLMVPLTNSLESSRTFMLNIDQKTLIPSSKEIYGAELTTHSKLVDDLVMEFSGSVLNIASLAGEGSEFKLKAVPSLHRDEVLCSKYGSVYTYIESIGVYCYHTDGSEEIVIPQSEIEIKDYQSLDKTSIQYFVVGSPDCFAFYDGNLDCIRMIQKSK